MRNRMSLIAHLTLDNIADLWVESALQRFRYPLNTSEQTTGKEEGKCLFDNHVLKHY